ncbi:hypothetical protein MKX01_009260 [Papaver californicum]|nr:hypothetical protein MKX01_009260 [Papaver californicum]
MACFFINGKIFLVVLTISFGFSSVTDGIGIHFTKTMVVLKNDLSPNTPLNFHCKSADDDLGERSLAFDNSWSWEFHVNFLDTTLYWCDFWWVDNNGKPRKEGFQIYKAKRDMNRCGYYCPYHVRSNGIYGFTGAGEPYLMYKWPEP